MAAEISRSTQRDSKCVSVSYRCNTIRGSHQCLFVPIARPNLFVHGPRPFNSSCISFHCYSVSPQYLVNTTSHAARFRHPRPWLTALRARESIRLRCICQPNPLPRIETGSSPPPFSTSSPSLSASLFQEGRRVPQASASSAFFLSILPVVPTAPPKNTKPVTRKPDLAVGFYGRAGFD